RLRRRGPARPRRRHPVPPGEEPSLRHAAPPQLRGGGLMLRTRVMPCLLLRGRGLVKTIRFRDARYVGDPVNTVRIFNEKEVDELVFLDVAATPEGRPPNLALVEEIASECFMPFAYGGGLRSLDDLRAVFAVGVEKAVVGTRAVTDPAFVRAAADAFGSQSVVVAVDVRRGWLGREAV